MDGNITFRDKNLRITYSKVVTYQSQDCLTHLQQSTTVK